jgi:nucleoside 2-deoxyribosyltransferase
MNTESISDRHLVYMAGPLFDEGERWWIETMDELVRNSGFDTFLPHRDNPPKTADNSREIYLNDKKGVDDCTLIIANLNGITTDDGTAWELGYAFAHGKYSIGYFSDWRHRFPNDEKINLMMEESLDELVDSLEELQAAIDRWKAANA